MAPFKSTNSHFNEYDKLTKLTLQASPFNSGYFSDSTELALDTFLIID